MKKVRIISKRALLCCSFLFLINSTGQMVALSLGDKAREMVRNKITQLRTKADDLLKALDGYQQCVFKGTCTSAQKSSLKKIGIGIASLAALLVAAGVVKLGTEYQKQKKELEAARIEMAALKAQGITSGKEMEELAKRAADLESKFAEPLREYESLTSPLNIKFVKAVGNRDVRLAERSLDQGANVNTRDPRTFWTPLSIAVDNRDEAMIKLLLGEGADVSLIADAALQGTSNKIKGIISMFQKP